MSDMENKPQDVAECSFAKKIWSLPIVRSAADMALSTYSHVKEYNSVSKTTFGKAEETIASVANLAKPLLVKIEAPLTAADKVACQALTKLEEKVPAIAMTPEDIGAKAKQVWTDALKPAVDNYNSAVVYGTKKLNSAKVYGLTKANEVLETPVGKKVTGSLDELLNWADKNVDSHLPASESEGEVQPLAGNVARKAAILSSKIARRLCKRTDDCVTAYKTYLVDVYNKSDVPNHVKSVKTTIVTKTSEFFVAATLPHLKEQAQKLSTYAKDSYQKLQATPIPERIHTAVTATKSYADMLYAPISEAKTWGDISTAVSSNVATVAADVKKATWSAIQLLRSSTASNKASDASQNSQ